MNMQRSFVLGVGAAMLSTGAQAQQTMDYDIGEYEYAQEAGDASQQQDVQREDEADGAQRVIQSRRDGPSPTFVERPVVQPIASIDPDQTGRAAGGAAGADFAQDPEAMPTTAYSDAIPATAGSAALAQSGDGAMPAAQTSGRSYAYRAGEEPKLPAGGRLVQFDRSAWLMECTRRLDPQGREDGARGDEMRDDARSRCETYLDRYMASARSGGLRDAPSPSGDYFLVPVTVMQPREARYSDGTPVRPQDQQ